MTSQHWRLDTNEAIERDMLRDTMRRAAEIRRERRISRVLFQAVVILTAALAVVLATSPDGIGARIVEAAREHPLLTAWLALVVVLVIIQRRTE